MAEEIAVNKLNVADKSVIKYMESITKGKGLEKGLFDFYKTMDTIKSGTIILMAITTDGGNNKPVGILIAKRTSDDKNKYLKIKVLDVTGSDKATIADALISKLIETKGKEVGIKTESFSNKADYIGKALTKAGFKISANTYGNEITKVNGSTPNEALVGKRFNFGTKIRYGKATTSLLTQHDIVINKAMNKTEGKDRHPVGLVGNKDHERRLSFFIKDLSVNPSWYCFLLFKKGEKEPTGIIKSQTYKTGNLCFASVYVEGKDTGSISKAAFGILKEALSKTKEKFLGSTINVNDSNGITAAKAAFGSELGHQYYK